MSPFVTIMNNGRRFQPLDDTIFVTPVRRIVLFSNKRHARQYDPWPPAGGSPYMADFSQNFVILLLNIHFVLA